MVLQADTDPHYKQETQTSLGEPSSYLPLQSSSLLRLKIQLQHDRLESELVDFPMNWADRH